MDDSKLVIIINGKGGSGKDTICDILNKHYPVTNVSTITKVKQAARLIFGWRGGKTDSDRKFLSDLKDLWTEYNDGPFKYAMEKYHEFDDKPSAAYKEILVIHVREPQEIDKLKKAIDNAGYIRCATLLVKSDRTDDHGYGNHADDAVEEYAYNFVYHNDGPLNELDHDFMWFFHTCVMRSWQESH